MTNGCWHHPKWQKLLWRNGLGFQLVPWNDALTERIDQQINGIAMPGGGIDWTFGRSARPRAIG
jgi:hypothetical protein